MENYRKQSKRKRKLEEEEIEEREDERKEMLTQRFKGANTQQRLLFFF